MYERDEIIAILQSNDNACEVGIYRLFQLQTEDEKQDRSTTHLNGVGFNAHDAETGTHIARTVEQYRMTGKGTRRLGENALRIARQMCVFYSRQLTAIANGELEVPKAPWQAREVNPEPEPTPEVRQPTAAVGPEPGTYAYTARMMHATMGCPDGDPDFWDRWKDEQKEADLYNY
jgi:hypothetical protein